MIIEIEINQLGRSYDIRLNVVWEREDQTRPRFHNIELPFRRCYRSRNVAALDLTVKLGQIMDMVRFWGISLLRRIIIEAPRESQRQFWLSVAWPPSA